MTLLAGAITSTEKWDKDEFVLRYDWILWRILRGRAAAIGDRLPAFGDHVILHPSYELPEYQRSAMPYVRYSSARHWLVRRSHSGDGDTRAAAYQRICDHLVTRREYRACTAAFSAGDASIERVALRQFKNCGAAATWVTIMTSHHMFYVMHQLEQAR